MTNKNLPYDVKETCNKCGGKNEIVRYTYDGCAIDFAETKCKDCGFCDQWDYGHFASHDEGFVSKCDRYGFVNGKYVREARE